MGLHSSMDRVLGFEPSDGSSNLSGGAKTYSHFNTIICIITFMDDTLDQNQEDFSGLEKNAPPIGDDVLNTPAKQPKLSPTEIPTDQATETYFKLNSPKGSNPDSDVVLDLDGKSSAIKATDEELKTQSSLLQQVLGEDYAATDDANPNGAIVIMGIIFLFLVLFIVFTLKQSDYMRKLEGEVEKLRNDKIY